MVSQRNLFFDFAKGLLIFLVVLGHCLNELHIQHSQGLLDRWINSFHMPAFMFVSGWFAWHALDKGLTNIVINKLKRLAIPALIWSFVIFLQRIFMGESISIRLFYDSCRCMWFLWCLLALFIISGILWNSKYRLWLGFCLTVALLLLWPYYPNDLLKHFNIPLHFPIFFFAACISEKVKGNTPPRFVSKNNLFDIGCKCNNIRVAVFTELSKPARYMDSSRNFSIVYE